MPVPFGPPWVLTNSLPASPPAASPYTLTFAAGSFYHILAVDVTLTTSAVAGSRYLYVQYLDPTGATAALSVSSTAQAPSQALSYRGLPNLAKSAVIATNNVDLTLPDVTTPESWQFQINVNGFQAGDQISSISILYESLAYV